MVGRLVSGINGDLTGAPKDMGPPYGKRNPYYSHIFRDSYGVGLGNSMGPKGSHVLGGPWKSDWRKLMTQQVGSEEHLRIPLLLAGDPWVSSTKMGHDIFIHGPFSSQLCLLSSCLADIEIQNPPFMTHLNPHNWWQLDCPAGIWRILTWYPPQN